MESQKSVVVGFDGSPDAVRALRWAVDAVQVTGHPLRVVVARGDLHTLGRWADEWTSGLAAERLDEARKLLAEQGAQDPELVVRDGLAPAVLTEESASAELLVIGSRGLGAIAGSLQGSVSQQVTRHASCPVVVVRAAADERNDRVVVGVDGSPHSLEALDFAVGHAAARGRPLTVIYVPEGWRAYVVGPPSGLVPELVAELEKQDARVVSRVEDVLARHPEVHGEVHQVDDHPARALADASQSAALVVVGSRGRGAFAGMALGSVSADVVRQAACPVAVVR